MVLRNNTFLIVLKKSVALPFPSQNPEYLFEVTQKSYVVV